MFNFLDIPSHKNAIIFELDNVLIPQKDYDLQVYYLFANFIEYLVQFPPATEMIDLMKKHYEFNGGDQIFKTVVDAFGIDEKYEENLAILFTNAKLPLKLLMYQEVLSLLQEIIINRKQVYILTSGNPIQQLNKIKQTEWNGLDQYLKVYFVDEFEGKSFDKALNYLLKVHQLSNEEVIFIGYREEDRANALHFGIDYKSVIQ